MTRRLPLALALSAIVALPSTAFAGQAPLHPAPGDAPAQFKGVTGTVSKSASKKRKKRKADPKAPVVSKVSPRSAKVGDLLVVSGRNFVRGKGKNKVAFYTRKGGAVFARDEAASGKRLKVRIPAKLATLLPANGDKARIVLRVRGKRFGKRTAARVSPLIAINPNQVGGDNSGGGGAGTVGCSPDPSNPASDVDQDLLTDARERELAMNSCNRDSDGDGASDGYEYHAAFDLNSNTLPLPYPYKRPYPNALFKDSEVDYDGDGLTVWDEYSLWTKYGAGSLPLNYSDGRQATVATPAPDPAGPLYYLDMNRNTVLSDDERDADGDGLSNWDESHGRMTAQWWKLAYDEDPAKETPYTVTFSDTDMLDPDTDGDGRLDGADDQDFDGLSNAFEVERPDDWFFTYVAIGYATHNYDPITKTVVDPDPGEPGNQARYYSRVQPFNPCKPVWSKNCHLHWPFKYYEDDEAWQGHKSPPPPGPRPGSV